jgi:AcrR family transcriptional regulator
LILSQWTVAMDPQTAKARVLDAAEELFYGHGVQGVGMDDIRSASGVSLKRLYQLFPAKEVLVEEYLRRRDTRWRESLARYVEARPASADRILAVFDWLSGWFGEPGFRGCAFINSFGELGSRSTPVAAAVRDHKEAFRRYLSDLVDAAGAPPALADHLLLLAEGAITTAAISGTPDPAHQAREAARLLLEAS